MLNYQLWSRNIGFYSLGLIVVAGIFVLGGVVVMGVSALIAFLYPVFLALLAIAIAAFVFAVLPLSFVEFLRPRLIVASLVISTVISTTTWMYSFLVVLRSFGFLGIFFCFAFQFLSPVAAGTLFVQGEWWYGLGLVACWMIAFGVRAYAAWLMTKNDTNLGHSFSSRNSTTIDAEYTVEEDRKLE